MDPLRLGQDDTAPRDRLIWLVAGLPGDWEVEGSGPTWRAERHADGMIHSVGLVDTSEGRLVSWRVDPEIRDAEALAVLACAIAAAVLTLAVASGIGHPGWGMVLSAPALLGVLHLGRRRVRAGLPRTDEAEAALGAALRRRAAQTGSGSSITG